MFNPLINNVKYLESVFAFAGNANNHKQGIMNSELLKSFTIRMIKSVET